VHLGNTSGAGYGPVRGLLRTVAPLLTLAAPACARDGAQSTLAPDGPAALAVFELWWVLLGLSAFVVLLVHVLLVYALLRRRAPAGTASPGSAGIPSDVVLNTEREDATSVRWVLRGGLFFPLASLVPLFVFTLCTDASPTTRRRRRS
jgi:hypothetical protein